MLKKITQCDPRPDEILIHCDGGWQPDPASFAELPSPVTLLYSKTKIGPGGGRHACIHSAKNELVASFDDDSWPIDKEYFGQAQALMEAVPDAAVLSPEVYLLEKPIQAQRAEVCTVQYYQGSASVHRRSLYLTLRGFVPIPQAYGIEETDLSLQTHAAGYRILESPWLRAWHDRPLADNAHQAMPWIKNEILLAYLRYPRIAQPWGWWRAWRQLWRNRQSAPFLLLLRNYWEALSHCKSYQAHRHRYSLSQVLAHLRMRRECYTIEFDGGALSLKPRHLPA